MNCLASSQVLDLYLDGELAPRESIEVLGHLEHCISCREIYWRAEELHRDIRLQVKRYTAPPRLRQNIQAALRRAAATEAPRRKSNWNWIAVAASILLFASLSWNITFIRSRPSVQDRIAKEILSSHLRSMVGTHLLDVPSSDQHTVKPWFAGKLDFSPRVKDLKAQGFELKGARLDYVDNRPVAASCSSAGSTSLTCSCGRKRANRCPQWRRSRRTASISCAGRPGDWNTGPFRI